MKQNGSQKNATSKLNSLTPRFAGKFNRFHATPSKSTRSQYLNSSVQTQIQVKLESQFEFAVQDTQESELLVLVDSSFGVVAFPLQTIIAILRLGAFSWVLSDFGHPRRCETSLVGQSA